MKKLIVLCALIPLMTGCETITMITEGAKVTGQVIWECFCEDSNDEWNEKQDKRIKALEDAIFDGKVVSEQDEE